MGARYSRLAFALALGAGLLTPAAAVGQEEPEAFHSDNMSHVANIPYEIAHPDKRPASTHIPYGTDIEFVTLPVDDDARVAVQRLAGPNRIATAAAVSAAEFEAADTIVVATSQDFADALAGSPLAVAEAAPLLLTDPQRLSPDTAAEIDRLGATNAILLGGPAALSDQVERDLQDAGLQTRRIAGTDRFHTAALIMDELAPATEVLVTEGLHPDRSRGWPDALSAAGLASAHGLPILLVTADELPAATAGALSSEVDATIIGGVAAVSEAVAEEIDERAADVARIAGVNRYDTSRAVAQEAITRGASAQRTWIATGRDFPDGLVAGAATGAANGVLLLVDGLEVDGAPESRAFLREKAARIDELVFVGGPQAISPEVADRLRAAASGSGEQTGGGEGGGAQPAPSPDKGSDQHLEVPEGEEGEVPTTGPQPGTRDFAVGGSYYNGMQIVDITDPTAPRIAAVYDCGTLQGDIQIVQQGTRTFATFTSEDTTRLIVESRCVQDNVKNGQIVFEDLNGDGAITTYEEKKPAYGTYIAEITDPYNPKTAGFIPVPEGSHNGTVHPSGNFFYNSNSRLITDSGLAPGVEVYDISDLANKQPERLGRMPLPPQPVGVGTDSHDITFNADGTRAYSAALSQTVIINTEDPGNPSVISRFVDPSINVEHQSDPITVTAADGTTRDLLIVQDELAGAAGNGYCPGGGLHVYDITGDNEKSPQSHKVGVFFIPEFRPAGSGSAQGEAITCTSHVYRLYPEQGIMTIAWYNAGVWVVDISGLAEEATHPAAEPMEAVGFFYFENSDTWSFKTNKFEEDGSFYGYGNDIARGLDVYRFEAADDAVVEPGARGRWLTPEQALAEAQATPRPELSADNPLLCLIGVPDQY